MPPEQTRILERYLDGVSLRTQARDLVQRANEMRAEGAQLMERARDAADLLGFDLDNAFDRWASYVESLQVTEGATVIDLNDAAPATSLQRDSERPTVREFILAEAEAAAPGPVRAADLRRKYEEKYGLTVHEKTFGMSLYRLSLLEYMRREGHADWFFIPEHQRPAHQQKMDFDTGSGRRGAR